MLKKLLYILIAIFFVTSIMFFLTKAEIIKKQEIVNLNINEGGKINELQIKESSKINGSFVYGPSVVSNMNKEDFWLGTLISKNHIIMDKNSIEKFNEKIYKSINTMNDVKNFPEALESEKINNYILKYKLPSKNMVFQDGRIVPESFYKEISDNRNLLKGGAYKIKSGIVKSKSSIRSFPTSTAIYENGGNKNFDYFQETGINALKAVAILNESVDKKWYFIACNNYVGWINSEDILEASKDQVKEICYPENFVLVKSNYVILKGNIESNEFKYNMFMGGKLPLVMEDKESYLIKLPVIIDGKLKIKDYKLDKRSSLCAGYLPYTKENVIHEAFVLLGENYDWGDRFTGRDCSSFVLSIYSTFGFDFPRNTFEQKEMPAKITSLRNAEAGDIIYMNGHEMLYLGKYNGNNFMIHSFTKYSQNAKINNVYKVGITSCDVNLSSGEPYSKYFEKILNVTGG